MSLLLYLGGGKGGLDIPCTRSHVKILQIGNISLKNATVK